MNDIRCVKCTSVLAQMNVGFYDEAGNMLGEQTFPQVEGKVASARLFHPHPEQLRCLIDACLQQAWETINANAREEGPPRVEEHEGNSREELLARR